MIAADVVQGCVQYLTQDDSVTSQLGSFTDATPWIFQDNIYQIVKGTSKAGLSIATRGGWQPPNLSHTTQFPRLWVGVYSDPSRDAEGNVSRQDATANARAVLAAVALKLHKPDQSPWLTVDQMDYIWCGGQRVLKSLKLTEPDYLNVAEGDGLILGSLTFALTVG